MLLLKIIWLYIDFKYVSSNVLRDHLLKISAKFHVFYYTVNFRFKHVWFKKFFDLRKNFIVPKILVHKMFDLRKISRNPFFDLWKKNQAFWAKKGNFWQKMLKLKSFFILITKQNMKKLYMASYLDSWASYLKINNIWKCSFK